MFFQYLCVLSLFFLGSNFQAPSACNFFEEAAITFRLLFLDIPLNYTGLLLLLLKVFGRKRKKILLSNLQYSCPITSVPLGR